MARYFDRLAKRTGLLAAEPSRAPAAQDGVVEQNEEIVAAAPAVSPQTVPRSIAAEAPRATSAPQAADIDAHAGPSIEVAQSAAPPDVPVVQRKRSGDALPTTAAMHATPPTPAPLAPRAERAVADGNAAGMPATRATPVAAAPPPVHAPQALAIERGAPAPLRAPPLDARAVATPPAPDADAQTAAPLFTRVRSADASRHDLEMPPAISPAERTAPASPPRARAIAAVPAAPASAVSTLERVERTGTRVHIGRIDIAIHAPALPALPPLAPPRPAPERAREPAFSPSRHYLRG